MLRRFAVLTLLTIWLCAGGCATTRVVTISTIPADARIRVDNRDRGRGPRTETFIFSGGTEVHHVQVDREGYRPRLGADHSRFLRESLVIELKPASRRVTFSVAPMPATIKLDGKALSPVPVSEISADVEFRIEPSGKWTAHRVLAEREGFQPRELPVQFEDTELVYELKMEPMRKKLPHPHHTAWCRCLHRRRARRKESGFTQRHRIPCGPRDRPVSAKESDRQA